MDSSKYGRWIIQFKKFGRLRVNNNGGKMTKKSLQYFVFIQCISEMGFADN